MSARGRTTRDRSAPGRRSRGQSVAERALRQIRFVAVALLLVGGAGYRPSGAHALSSRTALSLAVGAAALLLTLALLVGRSARAHARRPSRLALVTTVADASVVLGVVWLAGLPPRSFALVLLMLPLLESALWFGLLGLAALWTACSVVLGGLVVVFPELAPRDALGILVAALPTLLLATIPVAMLAEHLVGQVGSLASARQAADDRARLLGDLSAISAEIFPLDMDAVLAQLASGARTLGADGAEVTAVAGGRHAGHWTAGRSVDAATTGDDVVLVERELPVPTGEAYLFRAAVRGEQAEVTRRVEALDLLVAQARVGLANAALVRQLDALKQTYEQQATRDQLTGLLNRRGLVARAEQLPGHLGVLFCDLDGFKSVNDTLGHAAGDELLEKVARRLEQEARDDIVLARLGGDEFVLLVPDASADDLAAVARRVELHLGRPFLLEAGMARIGVSIGAAHAAPGERDLDGLLGRADHLMYRAKHDRRADRRAGDEADRSRAGA